MINLEQLNLPTYRLKIIDNKIYSEIRKKWLKLTPEEWVRQNFLKFIMSEKHYPRSLIKEEEMISAFNQLRRCDAVLYNNEINPLAIIECKAPHINITEKTFKQIAVYNNAIQAPYLILTNGLDHYCVKVNFTDNTISFIDHIPEFAELNTVTTPKTKNQNN